MISLLKNIFLDVFKLYKNFFHWNLSKLIIFIWSIILAILGILPFVIIMFVYGYFAGIDLSLLLEQLLTKQLGSDLFINIFLYFITIVFFVMYFYGYILLIKLNFEYKNSKKLTFLKNYYFNFKKIKKYINLTLINGLILFIPILFFVLLIFVISLFIGPIVNIENIMTFKNTIFTVISLLGFIVSLIIFVYLFYRICFSYFELIIDKKDKKKTLDYFKISFEITAGFKKFFKFLLIITIFLIFMFPLNFVLNSFEKKVTDFSNFIIYTDSSDEEKDLIMQNNSTYIQVLLLEYSKYSREELNNNFRKYDIYIILLNIFNFLVLYGVIIMVFTSFYKRELVKNK